MVKPDRRHDDDDGDELQDHPPAHEELRAVAGSAAHHVPQAEEEDDENSADGDRHEIIEDVHAEEPFIGESDCRASIAAFEQTAGDDLRLDFGGTLEDVEDASIAEYARYLEFEGEAVAAVDLERIFGGRPGGAGGNELGHSGFNIAAPAQILLARRI